ncbi:MAG: hypothetical protein KDA37_00600, partial [Planctomycetales bacterium]|nr:hypothetical protein [Planctomycetales bacterium]
MTSRLRFACFLCLSLTLLAATGPELLAVPYASGVRNTAGQNWQFVLNEAADTVTISRDGGNEITLNAAAAGRYDFDMTGFTTFDIKVEKSSAAGWFELSSQSNAFTKYERPSGLAINTDPNSPYFGTVYVANGRTTATGHASGSRMMGDGVYSLTADLMGVDLSTGLSTWTVPDPDDTTQARAPSWDVIDGNSSGANSVFRISLDDGGNVIAGDWSDENGGIKYASPDLTSGGLVLQGEQGPTYGYLDPGAPLDGSVSPFVHGSIRGVPNVTGTVGVDLVVRAMDEDLNRNPTGLLNGTYPNTSLPDTGPDGFPTDGNHVWKWDVGAQTNSVVKPQLLIDVGGSNDPNDHQLGSDTGGRPYILDLNIGVRADAEFFPQLGQNGLWIVTQPRSNGDESGIVFVEVDETGATDPQVLWASRQFTIDNNLDGFPGDPEDLGDNPNSDVFRNTGSVDVSADGKTLVVHRWFVDAPDAAAPNVNPYLGRDSDYPGAIVVIPLDENGLPDIQIDDNGTPGNGLDDSFTNLQSITTTGQASANNNHEIEYDAAGNVYITDNISELLQVFSPGGDSTTLFSFDGSTFSFGIVEGLPGDYN